MKKYLLVYSVIVLGLCLFSSCSSSDDVNDSNEKIFLGEVQAEDGIILLDESVGRWCIYCVKNGVIDSNIIYFPIQLENEFMEIGTHVKFSGGIYKPDFSKTLPAGTSYYLIDINYIEKTEDI